VSREGIFGEEGTSIFGVESLAAGRSMVMLEANNHWDGDCGDELSSLGDGAWLRDLSSPNFSIIEKSPPYLH
jgi:hypothetical protein